MSRAPSLPRSAANHPSGRLRVHFDSGWQAWREEARRCLDSELRPEEIEWAARGEQQQRSLDLLATAAETNLNPNEIESRTRRVKVARGVLSRMRQAAHHSDPERWQLLYRVLWRICKGELHAGDELDPDLSQLRSMAARVRRDAHKATAFVRFRKIEASNPKETLWVAWHQPDHRIARLIGPFFADRFSDRRWAILMPLESVYFDGRDLSYGPGRPRSDSPAADEMETLWRTYYSSIFNPARLKVRAMISEMPRRYWSTLPEATLIPELIRDSQNRTRKMIADGEQLLEQHPPAATLIRNSDSLDQLKDRLQDCRACQLCIMGRPVFGEGNPAARIMLIGEQPGDQEERCGRPFVGPAGQLLAELLEDAGIDQRDLYRTNVVKHFRHELRNGKRIHKSPRTTEVSSCLPWVEAEIEKVRPARIVCLGATASRALLGGEFAGTRDRGRVFRSSRFGDWVLPTWHPAVLLRTPNLEAREQIRQQLALALATAAAV